MTMTLSSSNVVDNVATGTSITAVLPVDVPSGASIIVGILNRTDESTTVSDVGDPVNGAYSSSQGPVDLAGANQLRTWVYVKTNSAALSGAGNRTITVNFSGSITSAIVAGWASDDGGALTFDNFATADDSAADGDSQTFAAAGGGGIVGCLFTLLNQSAPEPTADGAGESRVSSMVNTARAHMFFEAYASSGTVGFQTTLDASDAIFMVAGFLSPAGGGAVSIVPTLLQNYANMGVMQ